MTFNVTKSNTGIVDYGIATRPFPGELESGDLYAVITRPYGAIIAVVDGLGHGYEAALAAKVAINTVTAQAHLPLVQVVKACHEALVRTRGAAMAIASLDEGERSLTWLSIGNVAGVLLRASSQGDVEREHIMMRGGVVGQRLPPLRAPTLPLRKGDVLMFATDGIRNGFYDEVNLGGALQETAQRILLKYGKVTDDALVLVGRWNGRPGTDSCDHS
jgi:negative regulator of sigma-B (phosphoserine phosphatase)